VRTRTPYRSAVQSVGAVPALQVQTLRVFYLSSLSEAEISVIEMVQVVEMVQDLEVVTKRSRSGSLSEVEVGHLAKSK
jgi:hypothetical protein